MSIFTKDAEQIRKAKYRVKNAQGQYEVVYLETSADQVEETADRVFVTPAEKSQITANQQAISKEVADRQAADEALANRLNVIEGEGEGSVKKALQDAKSYSDAELAKKVAELQNADRALETRVQANEDSLALVDGKIANAKQEAVTEAKGHTNAEITRIEGAMNTADAAIKGRLDSLEANTADLSQIRTDIASNTSAINKEVVDRTEAVKNVNDALTAEIARATQAETTLTDRISDVEVEVGRVETSLTEKVDNAIQSAKDYADSKVEEVKEANDGLGERVETIEAELATVDTRIADAKSGAETTAKNYTDGQVTSLRADLVAADAQVLADAKAHAESKVQELNTSLTQTIEAVDTKVDGVIADVNDLEGRVSVNESDIANLKDAVSNKNNNTIVVNTEDEIVVENPNPKAGDIAFVISSKRAYIYKGVAALAVENVPAGWVVFDEITNELDLVDYMKTADANATFRKLSEKIAEADLATELATKINSKLDAGQVDSKISAAVNPVNDKAVANAAAITKEVSERKSEITRVEDALAQAKTALEGNLSSLNTKVDKVKSDLTASLTEKEAALQAEDTRINNRINKFVPVVSKVQPEGTETGHVWLELV